MRPLIRTLPAALLLLVTTAMVGCGGSTTTRPDAAPAATSPAKTRYAELVAQSKADPVSVDYEQLRVAFMDTPMYSPYRRSDLPAIADSAFEAKDWESARRAADAELAKDWTSIDGHFVAYVSARETERLEDSILHDTILRGLIASIRRGHDGRSAKESYLTISSGELYSFLNLMGYTVKSQSLVQAEGGAYDVMAVVERKSGQEVAIWFDISLQMAAEAKALGIH